MPKKLTKKARKLAATRGENAETFARKALKIRRMPPTEYNKIRIYYRIY